MKNAYFYYLTVYLVADYLYCQQNEEHRHIDDLIKNGIEEGMKVMFNVQSHTV